MSTDLKQRISALSDEQRRLLAQRLASRTRGVASTTIPRRAGALAKLPLSFAQQRLWFLDQVSPLNLAFAVKEMNRLSGPLDVSVFERALNEIVRRHEVLRTTFSVTDGEPAQCVMSSLQIKVEVEDLRGVPASERLAQAGGRHRAKPIRGLSKPDPGSSLCLAPGRRRPRAHPAASQHLRQLVEEHSDSRLATLFRAFSDSKPSPLAELPVQYGDFAVWG